MNNELDRFDLAILEQLRSDGRLTNQQLGERIGLSASQCSRRRLALEQKGLISGYHARLAPGALGPELISMIEISLSRHDALTDQQFNEMVRRTPEIVDAYKTTGNYDYMLKVVINDLQALNQFIGQVLPMDGAVAQIRTSVVLERIKENGQIGR